MGSESMKNIGIASNKPMTTTWPPNATKTVHDRRVFRFETKLCSNTRPPSLLRVCTLKELCLFDAHRPPPDSTAGTARLGGRHLGHLFIRRRPVHAGKLHFIEPQVNTELRAVVDQVIQDGAAHNSRTRAGHHSFSGELEGPGLPPIFVAGSRDSGARLGYVGIEYPEQFGARCRDVGFEIRL